MRALHRLTLASLALTLALTLAPAAPAAAHHARPMFGELRLSVAPAAVQRCEPGALTLDFGGVGLATHLGRVHGTGSNCTELSLATEAVDIWDGVASHVAADGSTIQTSYIGTQQAPIAGVAEAITTHTVTGGTGRFAGAAGSWTVSGHVDFTNGTFVGELAGWLSY
jgi:hypothetical protein